MLPKIPTRIGPGRRTLKLRRGKSGPFNIKRECARRVRQIAALAAKQEIA